MLTYRDLKSIQEGKRRHPDVMELLREVKRLRQLVVHSYVYTGKIVVANRTEELHEISSILRDAMRVESCVVDYERLKTKRDEIEYRRRLAMPDNRHPSEKKKEYKSEK